MNAAAGDERNPLAGAPESPGEMLRKERERRGLSIQQTAEDLHLDAWRIEALEQDRFGGLGAPVYARGYLRKYALLLGLSPDVVIARYEALSNVPGTPTPIPASLQVSARTERVALGKPLAAIAIIAAGVAIVWALVTLLREPESPIAMTAGVTAAVESPQSALPEQSGSDPDVQISAGSPAQAEPELRPDVLREPATVSEAHTAPETAATPAVARAEPQAVATDAPQLRLRLEFSDVSWVEVYDARDRRLMFGLGEPGRVRTLVGSPPLQVTLGAASVVTAHVNDEQIVIPRRAGRDASKFSIDAAGEVTPGGGA